MTPKVMVDQVGEMYRARIVVEYKRENALCISPEKFFEPKIVDLAVLPGLYAKRENAQCAAEGVLKSDTLRSAYGIRN